MEGDNPDRPGRRGWPSAKRSARTSSAAGVTGTPLPLVVHPADEAHAGLDALLAWAHAHVEEIDRCIGEDGGLLLRGFAVEETADFERVSDLFPAYEMGYEAGATARARIAGKVYEATRVPAEVWIMLHQRWHTCRRSRASWRSTAKPRHRGQDDDR